MDRFTAAYIETALWSSTDDNDVPLDATYSTDDLAPETLREMNAECADFQAASADLIAAACRVAGYSEDLAGYDYWLTRNGHGVGFWCRDLEEIGDALTQAAEAAGERWLYVGDDGLIYSSR
jgi:hypothetical protein